MFPQIYHLPLLLITCITSEYLPESQAIKNGMNCRTNSFPHVVSIKAAFEMIHVCGGSLIDGRNVLSAAHCYEEGTIYYAVAGQTIFNDFSEDIQMSYVSEVFVHPQYNRTSISRDIAVFRLRNRMVETDTVKFIQLPQLQPEECDDGELVAAGWGHLLEPEIKPIRPIHLQCVSLEILNHTLCKKYYNESKFDVSSTICTLDKFGYQGVCNGDSGGPLMCGNVQYAITSWGGACSSGVAPQVFTKVADYLTFINTTIHAPELRSSGDYNAIISNIFFYFYLLCLNFI